MNSWGLYLAFQSFDLLNFLSSLLFWLHVNFLTSISMSASLHLHMHTPSCLSHFTAISTEHSLGPLTLPCPILPHPSLPSVILPDWILRSQATEHHWKSWQQRDKSITQSTSLHLDNVWYSVHSLFHTPSFWTLNRLIYQSSFLLVNQTTTYFNTHWNIKTFFAF